MIASKEKLFDMQFRQQMLEIIEVLLSAYRWSADQSHYDMAAEFGAMSKDLKDRIDHGDYRERDEWRERVDKLFPQNAG